MDVYYTGLGVVLISLLWSWSGSWEWNIPWVLEEKVNSTKMKWYSSQLIVRFVRQSSISEQEEFAHSLRFILPKVERKLGVPIHAEVEVAHEKIALSEEEMRYLHCLSRSFSEFSWCRPDHGACEMD